MSILKSIVFFLSLGFLVVGAHQTFTVGFYESYWLFMLSMVSFFIYNFIKKRNEERGKTISDKKPVKSKKRK